MDLVIFIILAFIFYFVGLFCFKQLKAAISLINKDNKLLPVLSIVLYICILALPYLLLRNTAILCGYIAAWLSLLKRPF
ncbi:MAG: hypothetical protein PUC86_00965 [Solobacterium sp.]|nr:hypothetical protein [Solobacterium sp.]MDD6885133.1 hypothetical protein [Solobacterium sp.]